VGSNHRPLACKTQANRNRAHGTRKADGKEMNWIEHEFWRVENGRLAEQWSVADGLDIG
jgi:predicted ester cyclase